MNRTDDIVGYTYRADLYCPGCILEAMVRHGDASPAVRDFTESVESTLDHLADCMALDRSDERTFDSGDFPKVVFRDSLVSEGDDAYPERCGSCGEVLGS